MAQALQTSVVAAMCLEVKLSVCLVSRVECSLEPAGDDGEYLLTAAATACDSWVPASSGCCGADGGVR